MFFIRSRSNAGNQTWNALQHLSTCALVSVYVYCVYYKWHGMTSGRYHKIKITLSNMRTFPCGGGELSHTWTVLLPLYCTTRSIVGPAMILVLVWENIIIEIWDVICRLGDFLYTGLTFSTAPVRKTMHPFMALDVDFNRLKQAQWNLLIHWLHILCSHIFSQQKYNDSVLYGRRDKSQDKGD